MTGQVHACYRADFEFLNDFREVRSSDILYTSDNPDAAIREAVAWWRGRERNLSSHFAKILCIKVTPYEVGPLINGMLHNPCAFGIFEYKCDTAGLPLDEYVEYRINERARYAAMKG
jgi:hypothetical protein